MLENCSVGLSVMSATSPLQMGVDPYKKIYTGKVGRQQTEDMSDLCLSIIAESRAKYVLLVCSRRLESKLLFFL